MAKKSKETGKPSKDQIAAELAKLREIKPYVRHMTAFGEDNHEAIDAQIAVLDDMMDDDAIYDTYEPRDEEGNVDESGNGRHALDSAIDARRWLDGEGATPSEDWKSLDSRAKSKKK